MTGDALEKYLLSKPHAVKEYHNDFKADRYLVGGKMFAMQGGDKYESPILTLKLEPAWGEQLRIEYQGAIIAGYYMNKLHWNSCYIGKAIPDELWRKMIDQSYAILVASLTKKAREELGL